MWHVLYQMKSLAIYNVYGIVSSMVYTQNVIASVSSMPEQCYYEWCDLVALQMMINV